MWRDKSRPGKEQKLMRNHCRGYIFSGENQNSTGHRDFRDHLSSSCHYEEGKQGPKRGWLALIAQQPGSIMRNRSLPRPDLKEKNSAGHGREIQSASLRNYVCQAPCLALCKPDSFNPQTNLGNSKDRISDEAIQTLNPCAQTHAANMFLNQRILEMSILSRAS